MANGITVFDKGLLLLPEREIAFPDDPEFLERERKGQVEALRCNTMAYSVLMAHAEDEDSEILHLSMDALVSPDNAYTSIIQTARASGLDEFRLPFVLTNCHNSLSAIGGRIVMEDDKKKLFSDSDFISIHIPLSDATRNLVGKEEFSCMKESACFINTARGGIVDENALIQALEEKRIAGAGLDVTVDEPAGMDNPLFSFENVIMTPHCAGSSEEALVKASMACAKGCFAVLNNQAVPLPAVVV